MTIRQPTIAEMKEKEANQTTNYETPVPDISNCNSKVNQDEVEKQQDEDEEEEEEEAVDIPGIKNVWGSKYTLIGKCVWLGILVTCTIIMIVQVLNRVRFFISLPVSVELTLQNNDSMSYPDITVCSSDFFKKNAYKQIQVEVAGKLNISDASTVSMNDILQFMTSDDLYERTAYSASELVKTCTFEVYKPCSANAVWEPVITTAGVCQTLKFNASTKVSGSLYGLNMVMATSSLTKAWKILLHERRATPKTRMYTGGIDIIANYAIDIRVQLQQYHLLNSPSKACSEFPKSICQLNYLTETVMEEYGCRLPFMEDVVADYCEPPIYQQADDYVKNVLLGKAGNCTCITACESESYAASVDTTYYPDRTNTRVRIFYDSFVYMEVGEEFSYGVVPLLSDIGGTLGLFLGFSLLNIAELLETIYSRLRKKYLKPKEKHEKKKPTEDGLVRVKSVLITEKVDVGSNSLTKM